MDVTHTSFAQGLQLTPAIIEFVLLHLVRCQRVFDLGVTQIDDNFFRQHEVGYQALWAATKDYWQTYGRAPTHAALTPVVLARLADSGLVDDAQLADMQALLAWIFDPENSDEKLDPVVAEEMLQLLLLDRRVKTPLRQALIRDTSPDRLPPLIERLREQSSRILALTTSLDGEVFPRQWGEQVQPVCPTGVPFLDQYMGEGAGPQQVHVILTPTGVGKTLLSCQIAVSTSRLENQREREGHGRGKLQVLFTYEQDLRDIRVLTIANAAMIHVRRLAQMRDPSELSTADNLEAYERELFAHELACGLPVPGEQERLRAAEEAIAPYLRIADFSGSRDSAGIVRGYGGIPEIVQVLEKYRELTQREIGTIVIDWAGLCVTRNLLAKGRDLDGRMTYELTHFIPRVHAEICKRFNCVAWVTHQLAGSVIGKSPTYRVTHADALGCRTFAVSAWYAFCLGNKDTHTNTCILWNTKGRNSESKPEQVCRIRGEIACIQAAPEYVIDRISGAIVRKRDLVTLSESSPTLDDSDLTTL